VEVAGPPATWNGKHLRVLLRQNGRTLALKAWNFAERASELPAGARVDVAFSVEEDTYAGGYNVVMRDVRSQARTAEA
jgi:hypothetical protein